MREGFTRLVAEKQIEIDRKVFVLRASNLEIESREGDILDVSRPMQDLLTGDAGDRGNAGKGLHSSWLGTMRHLQSSSSLAPGTLVPNSRYAPLTLLAPGVRSTIIRQPAISYRPIRPSDLEVLQDIHEAFFPIKYELEFFSNVVHGQGIISWAAIDTNRPNEQADELIGFVTARVVPAEECEEVDMLGYELGNSERTLIYILTLGVIKQYRNLGIASGLVGKVIQYAVSLPTCRAVYLHVIAYNNSAIHFYKKNSFQYSRRLSNFYYIRGHHYDSYLYIYFVNGGRSPYSAIDLLTSAGAFVRSFFTSLRSWIFWKNEKGRALKWSKCNETCGLLSPCPNHRVNVSDNSCV